MYKFKSLQSITEIEDVEEFTREDEETILISEYRRTLKLHQETNIDAALSLFNEMLDTQILSEAIELDDTDVYTVNKLGQIALSRYQFDVAQWAFEKCLERNSTHWPSIDGILRILCQQENYRDAYGWALMWYDKNPSYTRALDVISEIRELFQGCGLEYIENCSSIKFTTKTKRKNYKSVFPKPVKVEPIEESKPILDEFKIESFDNLTWDKLGRWVINLYDYLSKIENGGGLCAVFECIDFCEDVDPNNNILMDVETKSRRTSRRKTVLNENKRTNSTLQWNTKGIFSQFISEIKTCKFTVIKLVNDWLKQISSFWEHKIPISVIHKYLQLYRYNVVHQFSEWSQLPEDDFNDLYQITLLYLESSLDQIFQKPKEKNQMKDWLLTLNHLIFHSIFLTEKSNPFTTKLRLKWLQYCWARFENDLKSAIGHLKAICDFVSDDDTFILKLPNNNVNDKISYKIANDTIISIEQEMNEVKI